jgi:hypothetical protein
MATTRPDPALEIARILNRQLAAMLIELKTAYPADADFAMFQDMVEHVGRFTPRKLIELFAKFILPAYGAQVKARDDAFFLRKQYDDELPEHLEIVKKLKVYWDTMDAAEHENVWAYMTVFVTLTERYAALVAATPAPTEKKAEVQE